MVADVPEEVVCYIYELQVISAWQSKGIGRKCVDAMKKITAAYGLRKCILTCFTANTRAMAFYQRMGFGIDDSSPSQHDTAVECYEILSTLVVTE